MTQENRVTHKPSFPVGLNLTSITVTGELRSKPSSHLAEKSYATRNIFCFSGIKTTPEELHKQWNYYLTWLSSFPCILFNPEASIV
jgi:hypothetical protein